jgi:hypothetical protein
MGEQAAAEDENRRGGNLSPESRQEGGVRAGEREKPRLAGGVAFCGLVGLAPGHRASLAAGALGELIEATAIPLAASHPETESLPGSHQAAAIIIGRSGVPRRTPWAITVSMENGAT